MKIPSGNLKRISVGQPSFCLTQSPVLPLLPHNPAMWSLLEILMIKDRLKIFTLAPPLVPHNPSGVVFIKDDWTLASTEQGSFGLKD